MRRVTLIASALAGAALLAARDDRAVVGDKPEYKFGAAIENGLGARSLEGLRGKPTLFEFWGTY